MKDWIEDELLAFKRGVQDGYGAETSRCIDGVAVCAADWRTVDRAWLLHIETGAESTEFEELE